MKLRKQAILLVKYAGKDWHTWKEYRAGTGRNLLTIQAYFSNKPNFRFLYIYEVTKTKPRTKTIRVGYISKNQIDY